MIFSNSTLSDTHSDVVYFIQNKSLHIHWCVGIIYDKMCKLYTFILCFVSAMFYYLSVSCIVCT